MNPPHRNDAGDGPPDLLSGMPSPPTRIGRYELFYNLGIGGMASVSLGRLVGEAGFRRWVAIKRIHEHLAVDRGFRDMFLDEARVTARLNHPNLVQVTDFGIDRGRPYLVMEYVEGVTFYDVLTECVVRDQRLPLPLAARIFGWVCDGLHHAHELRSESGDPLSLVHRDLSPHNFLISFDGVVKVADFGVAKAADHVNKTRTGTIKGKVSYLSPEQVHTSPLDRRSDIFSLGIVLYEATTFHRLYRADSDLEVMLQVVEAEPPPPSDYDPDYPERLEKIVLRALEKDPDKRYATAREMQKDLEGFILEAGEPAGTAELEALMDSLFRARKEQLRAALYDTINEGPRTDVVTEPLKEWSGSNVATDPLGRGPRLAEKLSSGVSSVHVEDGPGSDVMTNPLRAGPRLDSEPGSHVSPSPQATNRSSERPPAKAAPRVVEGVSVHDRETELLTTSYEARENETKATAQRASQSSLWLYLLAVSIASLAVVLAAIWFTSPRPQTQPLIYLDPSFGHREETGQKAHTPTVERSVPPPRPVASPPPPEESTTDAGRDAEADAEEDVRPRRDLRKRWRRRPKVRNVEKRPAPSPSPSPAEDAEPGRISIMAEPWCDVYLGARRLGRTPLAGIELPAGRHVLLLLPEGKRPGIRRPVVVQPGKQTPISVNLDE